MNLSTLSFKITVLLHFFLELILKYIWLISVITYIYENNLLTTGNLKHKDSFGKSENLSKIFFTEILVFDHDYKGKSSSSNGLLWISFIFLKIIY